MIISHRHSFIFIKTTKTAGTSIETYLSPLCGPDDVFTPIYPPSAQLRPRNYGGADMGDVSLLSPRGFAESVRGHRFRNHMGAPDIRERVSEEVWNTYFKFCVERNPWDKVVSQYYMVRARSNSPGTFENFVSEGRFPVDSPKWYDNESRSFLVDRVLRYERLEKDLRGVFDQLGVPFADGLTTREKTHYRTDRRPFQTYYTTGEMVRAVADRYQLEIELLGYTFDEAADPWTGS